MTQNNEIDGMRARLAEKLAEAGVSGRAASEKAGLGAGYISSVLKNGQEPTVANLAKICAANGISLSYVIFGIEISPETRRLLDLMEKDPQATASILALLDRR